MTRTSLPTYLRRLLSLALVATKLVLVALHQLHWAESRLPSEGALKWMSALGIILPALSALSFGLKAYEEFEPLSELSLEMGSELKQRRERVQRVDLERPLASQVLGEEAFEAQGFKVVDQNYKTTTFVSDKVPAETTAGMAAASKQIDAHARRPDRSAVH